MNRVRFWISNGLIRLGRWLPWFALRRGIAPSLKWREKHRQRAMEKATREWQARTYGRYVENPIAHADPDETDETEDGE